MMAVVILTLLDAQDDDDVMGQLTQTECLRCAWHRPQGLHRQSLIFVSQ